MVGERSVGRSLPRQPPVGRTQGIHPKPLGKRQDQGAVTVQPLDRERTRLNFQQRFQAIEDERNENLLVGRPGTADSEARRRSPPSAAG